VVQLDEFVVELATAVVAVVEGRDVAVKEDGGDVVMDDSTT